MVRSLLVRIEVSDPLFQTTVFTIILSILIIATVRNKSGELFFSSEVTNEIKGFAILSIVFSHIGYFLSSSTQFLYPLSVLAGVGVNLFLILSGFGLTISQIHRPLSPWKFYKKRLLKLFVPLWIILISFFVLDYFVLNRSYSGQEIYQSFLGFFPRADLWMNVDSPLWYFTIILFYYLLFPLVFWKRFPFVSAIIVLVAGYLILRQPLPVDPDVLKLYYQHYFAFPLGMLLGVMIQNSKIAVNNLLRLGMICVGLVVFGYTAIHSGVGDKPLIEQSISMITALSILVIFTLSRIKIKIFYLIGILSYEIYLLHWPILSRYNMFLGLPPYLDVLINIFVIGIIAFGLQVISSKLTGLKHSAK